MGRSTKGTVDYFPHYTEAGKTLYILENDFGNDGYAFWFKLLEILGTTNGMLFDYNNPADVRFLLSKTRVDEFRCLQIIETLVVLEAIDKQLWINHRIIWVQNLVDNVRDAFKKRLNQVPQKPVFTVSENGVSSIIVVSSDGNPSHTGFPVEEIPVNDISTGINGERERERERESKEKEEREMKLKRNEDIVAIFEQWKSKPNLINHPKLTVHMQNQISYKLNDYSVDELRECIHHYSVILADPTIKLDTKWSLHDFLEKNHFEKFLTERDPYSFYPKINSSLTTPKQSKFDKNKELLLRGSGANDRGTSEIHPVQGIGSLPEPN